MMPNGQESDHEVPRDPALEEAFTLLIHQARAPEDFYVKVMAQVRSTPLRPVRDRLKRIPSFALRGLGEAVGQGRAVAASLAFALRGLGEAARVLLVESLLLFVAVFYFYPAGLWRAAGDRLAAVRLDFCFAQGHWPRWQVLVHPVLIGYVIWQLQASIIIILVLAVLGASLSTMLFGVVSGTSLSSIGNLACGLTLGIVGSTAGGALIAMAFGIAYALLVSQAGMPFILEKMAHTEVLPAVMGGLVGIVAPPLAMVGVIFLALALTSYVIGNAAAGQDERPRRRSLVLGAVGGMVTSGILRGLIMGVTPVVGRVVPDMAAFLGVFGSVGSVVLGTAVYWRSGSWKRSVLCGGLYLLTLCGLILMAFIVQRGTPMGLVMNGMAQALFQGTFFILSYMTGSRLAGPWAGALASGLDGAVGFTVFVLVTHWQVYMS